MTDIRDTQELPVVTLECPIVRHEDHREACDWIDAVLESVADGSIDIPPAPIDALVEFVRAGGDLGESPALALLDEIARLRRPA